MATYDNKIWLLKNIRDAFIATDDTGLCESVMGGEDFAKIFLNKALEEKKRIKDERSNQPSTSRMREFSRGDYSEEDDDREVVTQFDAYPDMEESEDDDIICGSYAYRYDDFGGHRQRSNTAQYLDKKEQALKKAAKIKVIKWESVSSEIPLKEIEEAFTQIQVEKVAKKKSLLTEQIENCPNLPHRQYLEYAKFDGTAQLGLSTKSFKIFMTMLPEKHQNYPIVVCVIANAKIKDLIGFTCYKYSIDHPDISLGSVQGYGLCIAEDDGEVDWAFPCLDANEPCSKFGFTCLGLVDLKCKNAIKYNTSPLPEEGGFSVAFPLIPFPKPGDSGQSHHNTSQQGSGIIKHSDADIIPVDSEEIGAAAESDIGKMEKHKMITEAPQYKAYKVHLLRKVRTNILVQLGISIDGIQVEPLVAHKSAFWSKAKYFLHTIDTIAGCQILEAKTNKTTFRIVYTPSHSSSHSNRRNSTGSSSFFHPNTTYKQHDFECDHDTAREIVEKVNTILDLRNSPCRREYKTAKEKKLQTRRSFHTKNLS